jgi:hypothetical protein
MRDELLFWVRLAEHDVDSSRTRLDTQLVTVGRHHDDRQVGSTWIATHLTGQFKTIHAGHVDIGHQYIGNRLLDLPARILAVFGHQHLISVCGQQSPGLDTHHPRIVGHHHHGLLGRLDLRDSCCLASLRLFGSLPCAFLGNRRLNRLTFLILQALRFLDRPALGLKAGSFLDRPAFNLAASGGLRGLTFGLAAGGGLRG